MQYRLLVPSIEAFLKEFVPRNVSEEKLQRICNLNLKECKSLAAAYKMVIGPRLIYHDPRHSQAAYGFSSVTLWLVAYGSVEQYIDAVMNNEWNAFAYLPEHLRALTKKSREAFVERIGPIINSSYGVA